MSTLRKTLYGIALLGALALLIWGQEQRITVAEKNTELAAKDTKTARDEADSLRSNLNTLQNTLNDSASPRLPCEPSRISCARAWQSATNHQTGWTGRLNG